MPQDRPRKIGWKALAGLGAAIVPAALLTARWLRRRAAKTPVPAATPLPVGEMDRQPAQGRRAGWLRRAGISPVRLLIFLVVFAYCVLLLTGLPRELAVGLLIVLVTGAVLVGLPRELVRDTLRALDALRPRFGPLTVTPGALAAARRVHPLLLLAEVAVVVGAALAATSHIADFDPDLELPGDEQQWLTSSIHLAAQSLRDYGTIPLWQPWLEVGEPLVDNPFAFLFNPVSALPSLILGSVQGLKVSVVLSAVVAGLGGWALGRVLGLATLGRVLLGLLLIGKGNMHAMFGTGYFQLAAAQAYFPWIAAGVLATLRIQHQRWPMVLTAVAFALLFWAGNIWYTLPMILCTAALALAHVFGIWGRPIDWIALRRLALAGVLTVCLSAITLLPIWVQRDYIGGHPDDAGAGTPADPWLVIEQFTYGDFDLYDSIRAPGGAQFYYSYVVPLWFVLLIFVLVPASWSFRNQPGVPESGRLWLAAIALIAFFTLWGIGGSPIMVWLYREIPLLRQWRFVGRALAVASFWIAVIVALRADGLWRAFIDPAARQIGSRFRRRVTAAIQVMLALGLIATSGLAAAQVLQRWKVFAELVRVPENDAICLAWLRAQHPDEQLYAYRFHYNVITPFLDYHVRIHDIEADYFPNTLPWTLGRVDLTLPLPEYGLAWMADDRDWLTEHGYRLLPDSPAPLDGEHPCLYQREAPTLDYAFTVSLIDLASTRGELDPARTAPVRDLERRPDQITLRGVQSPRDGEAEVALAVQERAYPGWQVEIDGRRARLESVGGLVGVILPRDGATHVIRFAYRPPLFYAGAAVTLVAGAVSVLYLLRADERLARWRAARGGSS